MLEYIIYLGISTINLNFWLNWFFDMVLEPSWQEVAGSTLTTPYLSGIFSACAYLLIYSNRLSCEGYVRVYNISWSLNNQLKFLVEYFLDMVLEPTWQEVTGSNLNYPSFKVEYLVPDMRRVCAASTLLTQRALVWEGVLKYITCPWVLTISLSFWVELVPWRVELLIYIVY